jgi:hypothetical protein
MEKILITNIDENNCETPYEKGARMTLSMNGVEECSFYPVFCESYERAGKLLNEYSKIKKERSISGKDLILHEVILEMYRQKHEE